MYKWTLLQYSRPGVGPKKDLPMQPEREASPSAVVVGGSIAGLSCALALARAGWTVTVLEKSPSPPLRSSTGAGLGLDPQSLSFLHDWTSDALLPTLPLSIDTNSAVGGEPRVRRELAKDEEFGFRAAHWKDVHSLLWNSIESGSGVVVLWGHQFVEFASPVESSPVRIMARILKTSEIVEVEAELVVAADGCLSTIRRSFLPDHKIRYSGYCAWRGVLDFSENETSETILGLRKAYPELGECLYFDLAPGTHSVLYELLNKRINWLWYVNQPEPELEGNSMTMKASDDMIKTMHREADRGWVPALAKVMQETEDPFINAIYDSDPLPEVFWGNVVLVGDAAHPTTPHGLRSTNMSIVDAGVLARCLAKRRPSELCSSLEEYRSIRFPVVSRQVLHARHLGRLKQGLPVDNGVVFDPLIGIANDCCDFLQQKSMPFFNDAPVSV